MMASQDDLNDQVRKTISETVAALISLGCPERTALELLVVQSAIRIDDQTAIAKLRDFLDGLARDYDATDMDDAADGTTATDRLSARQRGYTHAWDKAAAAFKREHPMCSMCERDGILTRAFAVDHIVPHKGNHRLFWDQTNWQPLCEQHHNRDKQRMERGGEPRGTDINGRPTSPDHPWNRKPKGGPGKKSPA